MRPTLRALLTATVVALALAAPAGAILNGQPDTEHPYVGILVAVADGQRVPICSGFLVTETTFVTGAHCVDALAGHPAYVSFDQTFGGSSPLLHGTAVPNPDFSPDSFAHDIGVVVLDDPITGRGFAELPSLGLLNTAAKKDPLTVVGYGATSYPKPDPSIARTSGDARISKLTKGGFNLRMSTGICYGDSGGPVLLGDSNVAVGINSYVNGTGCKGNAFAFRLDTPESVAFLGPYL